jgi:branched-chain amino acid aminotransferase
LYTPALSDGCVAGVMRQWIIEHLPSDFTVHETPLTERDLYAADEVFLTNSIQDIRWVQYFREKEYGSIRTQRLYNRLFPALYERF